MKNCFKCQEEKPYTEFYRHVAMRDGFLGKCKECAKIAERQRYEEKKEEMHEYDRLRYRTNIERIKSHKYRGIVNRCIGGHKNRTYHVEGMHYLSWEEYLDWWTENIKDFNHCYSIWVESDYKNKFAPSIDRIDSKKGYTPGNMQWLTFTLNCSKHTK